LTHPSYVSGLDFFRGFAAGMFATEHLISIICRVPYKVHDK